MKFTVKKEHFSQAVSDVSKAITVRGPLPILSGIKIAAEEDRVILTGSNGEIIIESVIHTIMDGRRTVDIHEPGSVVVSAKYLNELIRKMPGNLYIQLEDNQSVSIYSEDIVAALKGFASNEYPRLTMLQPETTLQLSGETLTDMIKQTIFAAGKNGLRPILTGVHFVFDQSYFYCTATDSLRLASHKQEIGSNLSGSYIVPQTSLQDYLKLMGTYSGVIQLEFTENYIGFITERLSFYSKLIAGKFPNTTSLIPNEFKTVITVDAHELLKGVDRAALFAGEWKNNNVNLTIIEEDRLSISSKSSETGTIYETQKIRSIDGDRELSIALDGKFLVDALKGIRDEEIRISFGGTMKPVLIEPVGHSSYKHLISPVRSY